MLRQKIFCEMLKFPILFTIFVCYLLNVIRFRLLGSFGDLHLTLPSSKGRHLDPRRGRERTGTWERYGEDRDGTGLGREVEMGPV